MFSVTLGDDGTATPAATVTTENDTRIEVAWRLNASAPDVLTGSYTQVWWGGGSMGSGEVEGTIVQVSRVSETTALRRVVPLAHGSLTALLGRLR